MQGGGAFATPGLPGAVRRSSRREAASPGHLLASGRLPPSLSSVSVAVKWSREQ